MTWTATILGEPCAKANSRRKTNWGGVIKSKKAIAYSKTFRQQLAFLRPRKQLEGDLRITIRIWYASRRPDLDESLILDLLQDHKDRKTGIVTPGVYFNDRQCKIKNVYWAGVDKKNPRCDIVVEEVQDVEEEVQRLWSRQTSQ